MASIEIVLVITYFLMGGGVYRLCKSSSLGSLSSVTVITIFIWPIIVAIANFAEE